MSRSRIATRFLGDDQELILYVDYDPELLKYWVAIKNRLGKSIVREKLFKGESAWMDAQRYANDLIDTNAGSFQSHIELGL